MALLSASGFQVRAIDAPVVKEPGKTGSFGRIHYSVSLPSLNCDFFKLTATEGTGTGESFSRFDIRAEDYIPADRGYSTAAGIAYATSRDAFVTVRVNTSALPLQDANGNPFDLLEAVQSASKRPEWLVPGRFQYPVRIIRGSGGAGVLSEKLQQQSAVGTRKNSQESEQERPGNQTRDIRIREVHYSIHDFSAKPISALRWIGMGSFEMAGGTRV